MPCSVPMKSVFFENRPGTGVAGRPRLPSRNISYTSVLKKRRHNSKAASQPKSGGPIAPAATAGFVAPRRQAAAGCLFYSLSCSRRCWFLARFGKAFCAQPVMVMTTLAFFKKARINNRDFFAQPTTILCFVFFRHATRPPAWRPAHGSGLKPPPHLPDFHSRRIRRAGRSQPGVWGGEIFADVAFRSVSG